MLQNRRERVEELNLEGQELRARRDLEKLRAEQAEEEERRGAQARAQERERLAQIEATRFDREKEQRRAAREREQVDREQQRREWHRSWILWAAASFPDWLTSEQIGLLEDAVNAALGNCEPGDAADDVARVLKARIERLIAPWRAEREARTKRELLVQRAVQLLFGATDGDKIRATRALRSALEEVPPGASDVELSTTVEEAVAPTKQAIEERQTRARREQLIEGAGARLSWNSTAADKVQVAAAVRTALANLPLQASQSEEQTVVAAAVAPIEQAIRKGIEEKRERERVERNKASLVSLGVFHVGMYIERLYDEEEIDYAAYSDEEWKAELQAAVRRRLERELTGEEEFDEVQKLVRRIIDDELDEDAES